MKNQILIPLFLLLCVSCTLPPDTEKYQAERNTVVRIGDKVEEIETGDVLLSNFTQVTPFNDYLIVVDYKAIDHQIYLFDRKTLAFVTSFASKGQGPGEIASLGHIAVDKARNHFQVSDYGKYCIFSYHLDSVLSNPRYLPEVKAQLKEQQFPVNYHYISDTLSIAVAIAPTGKYGFNAVVARWNMESGEITPMRYTHPDIVRKRVSIAVNEEKGIFVECYHHHDLMTICSLDGDLRCNIYGVNWNSRNTNATDYYSGVEFCGDKIVAAHLQRDHTDGGYPTAFLVFDCDGNYVRTLDVGRQIITYTYDPLYRRMYVVMDDQILFGTIDMTTLLD